MSQSKALAPVLVQGKLRFSISAAVPDNAAHSFCHFDVNFALNMGKIILNRPRLFISSICYSDCFHLDANKACCWCSPAEDVTVKFASSFGDPALNFGQETGYPVRFCVFPQFFWTTAYIMPQSRPRPLPSTFLPFHYSLFILQYDAVHLNCWECR